MKNQVKIAIAEIQDHFKDSTVLSERDGNGGANIIVDPVDLGPNFTAETRKSWVGFHIAYNYPTPDIYPHHVRNDIALADGKSLPGGMHRNRTFNAFNRPSTMISRRTNVISSCTHQSALTKLLKIVEAVGGAIERYSDHENL